MSHYICPSEEIVLETCEEVKENFLFKPAETKSSVLWELAEFNGTLDKALKEKGYNITFIDANYEVVKEFLRPHYEKLGFNYPKNIRNWLFM